MQAVAGQPFTATLVNPVGDITNLGARVEVPVTRAIASYWRAATLDGVTWTVESEAPVTPGEYLLVWRTGDPEPPDYETFIPLTVTASAIAVTSLYPAWDLNEIRPETVDVARLDRTRTVGAEASAQGIDVTGTLSMGGDEIGDFTGGTRPTADEVDSLIDIAMGAVLNELPNRAPDSYYPRAKSLVALYTVLLIEGSYYREQLSEGQTDTFRNLYNTGILNLRRSVEADLAQEALVRRMEPGATELA